MTTASVAIPQALESGSTARTTLRGVWLWLARAGWVAICASSLAMFALTLPLILRAGDYGDWAIERSARLFDINIYSQAFESYALIFLGLKFVAVAIFVGVALYIFWRKSDDWMAILVSLMLVTLPHVFNLGGYTENWYLYRSPWDRLLYVFDSFFNSIGLVLLFFVFFLFPDGRFVPHWARWVAIVPVVLLGAVWTSQFLHTQIIWDDTISWAVIIVSFTAMLIFVTWSQIYRYRYVSMRAQKSQTRIVVLSLATAVVGFALLFLIGFTPPGFMDTPLGAFATILYGVFVPALLPLAFGVAMLRDQLWASERVLDRAFVYSALTAILLVVYVLIVGALSEIFRASNNFLIAAIATGVVALLFQPLRDRLQRSINRFLYGQRDEPVQVLNKLGAQLENTLAPDAALPLIVESIGKNLRLPYVAMALSADPNGPQTEYGALRLPKSSLVTFPLKYQNENVGELVVARRTPNENFSSADLQLLENLARQAGAVAYTARLYAQLQQSREHIITEREQERGRLRRDLHDGLGPTLASQTLKLDAAMELLHGKDSANAGVHRILQDLKMQTQATVAEIRRIVYELRPPALDDLGLVGALRAHLAQSNGADGLQITLDAPDELPPLSAAVQVNSYRIVLEAVNNVVKHAGATHCIVRMTANGNLRLQIEDDGSGQSENFRAGVGITSMRERATELGGTLEIEPNGPRGTRVIAILPLFNL